MREPVTVTLRTLTPLWTGGAGGTPDRVHVTGLVGSLRWWYEALVRGLGSHACDPTAKESGSRDSFDADAYDEARRDGLSEAEALREGLRPLCPACYLFGATGWARLVQVQVVKEPPTTPLHFRSQVRMNRTWLCSIFGGEAKDIQGIRVPHGQLELRLVARGHDGEFALRQFLLALRLAEQYGGLGAKLQHGFGQVQIIEPRAAADEWRAGLQELADRLGRDGLHRQASDLATPYDLNRMVSLEYPVPKAGLERLESRDAHVGAPEKQSETAYVPCALDLRYKGQGRWGFRRWLEDPADGKGWPQSKVNALMGISKKRGDPETDDDRQASRLCFGMPHRIDGERYRLRVFGFAPQGVVTPEELRDLCHEYMRRILDVEPARETLGRDLLAGLRR